MAQGIVSKIYENPVTTKFGPKLAYNLVIDDNKYSGGFKKPVCSEGDTIEFQYTQNGNYMNITPDTIKVVAAASSQAQDSAPAASGGSTGKSQFRSIPELNRVDALKLAIENRDEVATPLSLIGDAILFDEYITLGSESEMLTQMLLEEQSGNPLDGE